MAVYIALSGERAPSWPDLRAAEKAGDLDSCIRLRNLTAEYVNIYTLPKCASSSPSTPSNAHTSA